MTSPSARRHAALVLIEFQREWLDAEHGRLNHLVEDRDLLDTAVRGAAAALAAARAHGVPVVHVPLVLTPGAPELVGWAPARLGLRAAIPKAGTWIEGEAGTEFAEAFRPAPGEAVVRGRAGASAFAGFSDLDQILRRLGVTELYLAGFATHVCVESTLREAHDRGYTVHVVHDACAAFTQAQQDHVREHVIHHFGAETDAAAFAASLAATVPVRH
ncbi:isochorismatase family cysteine hydrolase [Kitasatospora sp. NPDC048722]|uniref:isochorismatase family cysteine hydrolase n=1 Tax=Kitasatospora sp. NPDC048722 TaxID=3155639 RepID=UPI0033C43C0B